MMLALATLGAYLQTCAPSVAPDTMRAIISVESRGYIFAINDNTAHARYCVPGTDVFPCDRNQAIALAENAVRSGHSVDIGISQVNSNNLRGYHVTIAKMLEACENLRIGSAILASAYENSTAIFKERREALWHAIMAYNSGSLFAGDNYVHLVVDAAFVKNATPTVPSLEILRTWAAAPSRLPVVLKVTVKTAAGARRVRARPDPSSAPLEVSGIATTRAAFSDSFAPALSR